MTGNAGALEITVDGEIVPEVGKLGEVRRKILMEVESLKSGQAVGEQPDLRVISWIKPGLILTDINTFSTARGVGPGWQLKYNKRKKQLEYP